MYSVLQFHTKNNVNMFQHVAAKGAAVSMETSPP